MVGQRAMAAELKTPSWHWRWRQRQIVRGYDGGTAAAMKRSAPKSYGDETLRRRNSRSDLGDDDSALEGKGLRPNIFSLFAS